MKQMQDYQIETMDGPIRFQGWEASREVGPVRLPKRLRAILTVTVYVTESGDGVVREDIKLNGRVFTYANVIHAGTSPEWLRPDELPEGTKLLDAAWRKACVVEPALRPVREWQITKDFQEVRIPAGNGTYLRVRARSYP